MPCSYSLLLAASLLCGWGLSLIGLGFEVFGLGYHTSARSLSSYCKLGGKSFATDNVGTTASRKCWPSELRRQLRGSLATRTSFLRCPRLGVYRLLHGIRGSCSSVLVLYSAKHFSPRREMTKPGSTEALPRPFRHERPPEPNNPHNEFCTSEITTLFRNFGSPSASSPRRPDLCL